jgi:hypothetical protein
LFEDQINIDSDESEDKLKALSHNAKKNINEDIGNFSDNTIKVVVDKCFDQIDKKKKIKSPCIYVKHKNATNNESPVSQTKPQIKLINFNPSSVDSNSNNNNSLSPSHKKDSYQNHNTMVSSSASNSSLCSSSDASSIDNPNIKQTVVEKAADILNAPTNTILLSSSNEINELYSLKITFV